MLKLHNWRRDNFEEWTRWKQRNVSEVPSGNSKVYIMSKEDLKDLENTAPPPKKSLIIKLRQICLLSSKVPIPVAAQSKASVCGRSLAGIEGSNSVGHEEVDLLWVLCVVRYRSLRRDDHSRKAVVPIVVGVSECSLGTSTFRRPWPTRCCCAMERTREVCKLTFWSRNFTFKF